MRRWTVGVDFGGTNIKIGLVSGTGCVIRSQVLPSRDFGSPAAFVEGVGGAVESLARAVGIRPAQLRGVGVGAPGPVDTARGVVSGLVNVAGWRHVPLRRLLERRVGCRCEVDNDVNLAALGEWRFGAGARARHLVCLTLGTGVGGGLIIGGRLYRGARGAAGEIGHMVINPGGHRCGCGAFGCLESEVGTAAILRMARRAIRQGTGLLRALSRSTSGRLTPELICRAARQGDRAAREIWVSVGRSLGIGLGNVVNLLNPDRIVIGGGVAGAWPRFYPTLIRTIRAQALTVSAEGLRVVRARLGNRAGIVGAAVLVWDQGR